MNWTDTGKTPECVRCDYTVTCLHTMKIYGTVAVLVHAFLTCTIYDMELGDQLYALSALLSWNSSCIQ